MMGNMAPDTCVKIGMYLASQYSFCLGAGKLFLSKSLSGQRLHLYHPAFPAIIVATGSRVSVEWRWLPWFLAASMLLHAGLLLNLDQYSRQPPPAMVKPNAKPMIVEFRSLPKPKQAAEAAAAIVQSESRAATSNKAAPARQSAMTKETNNQLDKSRAARNQSGQPVSASPPAKGVDDTGKTAPAVDLSKILEDAHQVAKEAGERGDGRPSFDRRKLQVDPANLKAPNVSPSEEIEGYELANGYQRTCKPAAGGKKKCTTRMKDDPNTIFNANIDMQDIEIPPKPGEELAKRFKDALGRK